MPIRSVQFIPQTVAVSMLPFPSGAMLSISDGDFVPLQEGWTRLMRIYFQDAGLDDSMLKFLGGYEEYLRLGFFNHEHAIAIRGWLDELHRDPDDVDLIECHATGTPVGDAVEVASLRELWQNIPPRQERCVIGSVKSNIGHLLTAAGAAALTKVLLAMQHQTLPPTASFNRPQPGMELDNSPFTVLTSGTFWQRRGDGIPRRAAVSAFGFGGINAHLLVEEWISPPPSSPRWGENGFFSLPQRGRVKEGE